MRPVLSSVAAEADYVFPPATDPLALSLNENPFPPLPAVRSVLVRSIDAANRYPEFLPERLRSVIAVRIGVPAAQVVLGAGATGVVLQALQALTVPGDTMVISTPTFDGYPIIARMARLKAVSVPLDKGGHNDFDRLADAAATARVVVVCRPHNPTGTLEPVAHLLRFLRRVPRDTVVLLDEAYIEFAAPDHWIDIAALMPRFPNVVVVRTFSKAYGLAGLRIGYGVAAPQLAEMLWSQQLPFGIALTSLPAVVASYEAERTAATDPADHRRAALPADAAVRAGYLHHRRARELHVPAGNGAALERDVRRHRVAGALLPGRGCPDHRRQPRVHAGGAGRGEQIIAGAIVSVGPPAPASAVRKGVWR